MSMNIKTFFDQDTSTFTHVVSDTHTKKAAIIDSVLNYNPDSGRTSQHSADQVIQYVQKHDLSVEWILDTHIHADHITAASYLKEKLGGKIGIGEKIKEVLKIWIPIFNTESDTPCDGSQFDCLLRDHQALPLGGLEITVLYTPGHTPTCYSYWIQDVIFVGDTLLMPDLGTTRTDFPGGDAAMLYESIKKIFNLPGKNNTVFLCHDYPPENRSLNWMSTVQEQKKHNILVRDGISKEEYVRLRNERDHGKPIPKLFLPSIQTNLRSGQFGNTEKNGIQYIKIPINTV